MKSSTQKNAPPVKGTNSTVTKRNATNPGKPGNSPDQTPQREVENVPTAKPNKTNTGKTKIGYKK